MRETNRDPDIGVLSLQIKYIIPKVSFLFQVDILGDIISSVLSLWFEEEEMTAFMLFFLNVLI